VTKPEQSKHSKSQAGDTTAQENYDIAVIGGGVVGCAVARRFTLEGARVVLLEKGADILCGASKGNSAILHTGFDAPTGSLEQTCVADGYAEYIEIRERLNLPLLDTGALVVAWTEEEEARLDKIVEQAHANGVNDVRRIDKDELLRREPGLNTSSRSAVIIPGEHVIDPWSAPLSYLVQAVENGAHTLFSTEVTGGEFDGATWRLETTKGRVNSRTVVNCAGLYADKLNMALLGESDFEIRPRKGQFVVFDKAASEFLNAIILPVPNAQTKGILVTRTIFGNVLVGPTAEEQKSREDTSVDQETLESLKTMASQIIPAFADMPVTAVYAGIRPATEEKQYRISTHADANWITVGGIRSTGLTSALGIARHIFALYGAMGHTSEALYEPHWPRMPSLAEHGQRDWNTPGYKEIVCHCEMVSEREICAALESPVPAGSLSGLKRRTRATMGRCQGFYCSARLAEILNGRFDESPILGESHG
jgi:glycerol-3-phosphate dehydrogenase